MNCVSFPRCNFNPMLAVGSGALIVELLLIIVFWFCLYEIDLLPFHVLKKFLYLIRYLLKITISINAKTKLTITTII
jgi:hypothetical protein